MKIISGGQTGVDRAALDAAINNNVEYGGWVPLGGVADDHLNDRGLLDDYPSLKETSTSVREERTIKNVQDSDVTIIIVSSPLDSLGTITTSKACHDLGKDYFLIDFKNKVAAKQLTTLIERLKKNDNIVINFAGEKEEEAPGIYDKVFNTLNKVFKS